MLCINKTRSSFIRSFRYSNRLWAQIYVLIHLSEELYSLFGLLRLLNWRLFCHCSLVVSVGSQHAVSGTYDNKLVMDKHSGSKCVGSLRIRVVWTKDELLDLLVGAEMSNSSTTGQQSTLVQGVAWGRQQRLVRPAITPFLS